MILHLTSTIEITSYRDLEEKDENTAEDFYEPGTVLA